MQQHTFILDNGISKKEVASTCVQAIADQIRATLFAQYKHAHEMKIYYKKDNYCVDILKQPASSRYVTQ
ncbi:hypothetical protein [Staphylococcus pettenkoferi]|uniref:hypothetical protein n=1 Tax=Staphylococcus pettenkoferi TaxID=170573 RepID=UPI002552F739|nr:hypothetical protein [Staphylococcus pettenkoferi]MDK7284459.1 hypothetical protein [Staphylococcus pettenkoferi]